MGDWKSLAGVLLDDLDGNKVLKIDTSYRGNDNECCREVVRQYLKYGDVSWKNFIESLRKAGYSNVAVEVEKSVYVA